MQASALPSSGRDWASMRDIEHAPRSTPSPWACSRLRPGFRAPRGTVKQVGEAIEECRFVKPSANVLSRGLAQTASAGWVSRQDGDRFGEGAPITTRNQRAGNAVANHITHTWIVIAYDGSTAGVSFDSDQAERLSQTRQQVEIDTCIELGDLVRRDSAVVDNATFERSDPVFLGF